MRTVGEILKKARTEKKLTFEEIEKQIRIRKKFLMALEENAWEKLPSLPYIKGFLRSYSSYLGLKGEETIAIFRRQFRQREKAGLLPHGLTYPLDESPIRITPQVAVVGIVISFLLIFSGFLLYQYKIYTSPPNLTISTPKEGEIILSDKVQITGKTDIDAVISVNNQKIAVLPDGEFTTTISLSPGINTIVIESTSKYGKKKTINRTIQIQSNENNEKP